ncbi:MAG: hypothetical protein QXT63_08250, partial [Thermoplasmata archaeon]
MKFRSTILFTFTIFFALLICSNISSIVSAGLGNANRIASTEYEVKRYSVVMHNSTIYLAWIQTPSTNGYETTSLYGTINFLILKNGNIITSKVIENLIY